MEAVARDPLGGLAETGVAAGGPIGAIDIDLAFPAINPGLQIIDQVEKLGVHEGGFIGTMIPQEAVELGQGISLVAVADAVGYA